MCTESQTLEGVIENELAFRHRRRGVLQVIDTTGVKSQSPQRKCHIWALTNIINGI